jgi:hypothetical protein
MTMTEALPLAHQSQYLGSGGRSTALTKAWAGRRINQINSNADPIERQNDGGRRSTLQPNWILRGGTGS